MSRSSEIRSWYCLRTIFRYEFNRHDKVSDNSVSLQHFIGHAATAQGNLEACCREIGGNVEQLSRT